MAIARRRALQCGPWDFRTTLSASGPALHEHGRRGGAVDGGLARLGLQVVGRSGSGAGRRVSLRLQPNGADSVTLIAPEDADIRAAGIGPFVRPVGAGSSDGRYALRCFGRSCDGAVMDVIIGKAQPVEFIVLGWRPGLPASAGPLVRARPANARPQYTADSSLAVSRLRL